jgi:WhiB family transcriptional regulator, redox-sensing transcriptional regulator
MPFVRTVSRPAPQGTTAADSDWRRRAACANADAELFFPVADLAVFPTAAVPALAICHGCPVVADCLATAIDNGDDHSISGGMTPGQRRAYAARRLGVTA